MECLLSNNYNSLAIDSSPDVIRKIQNVVVRFVLSSCTCKGGMYLSVHKTNKD